MIDAMTMPMWANTPLPWPRALGMLENAMWAWELGNVNVDLEDAVENDSECQCGA